MSQQSEQLAPHPPASLVVLPLLDALSSAGASSMPDAGLSPSVD